MQSMESPKVNRNVSSKEERAQRRPSSYSVETPYGFHLDLDFLKYVDDIEKGNTIKRIPMQRRHQGRNGALLRNLSLPGYKSTQWNSYGSLWSKSNLEIDQKCFEFCSSDSVCGGFSPKEDSKPFTARENDLRFTAFDGQPLKCYVRPNLTRASSLPLSALLRKHPEDPNSPSSPRDNPTHENGVPENIFQSFESQKCRSYGTIQRLTAALERVGELEEEIGVIPELKTQICILQEERERLLLQLHQGKATDPLRVCPDPKSFPCAKNNQNKASDDWMIREYDRLEENLKASSEQVDAAPKTLPARKTASRLKKDLDNENRNNSLTQTLQRKVILLEHKLGELEEELNLTRALLKQQREESHLKSEKIKQLTKTSYLWGNQICSTTCSVNNQDALKHWQGETDLQVLNQQSVSQAASHVKRLEELLQEQWECLCKDNPTGKVSSDHMPSKVCDIQKQLTHLVDLLRLYVFPRNAVSDRAKKVPLIEEDTSKTGILKRISFSDDLVTTAHSHFIIQEENEADTNLEIIEQDAIQFHPNVRTRKNGGFVLKEDGTLNNETLKQDNNSMEKITKSIQRKDQTFKDAESDLKTTVETPTESGQTVNKEFMEACCFMKDHMDDVSDPDEKTGQALTVMFQQWFHVSAEEEACANSVALFLSEVKLRAPTVLRFLVNMRDDNGNTALHYSTSHRNLGIVKLLLDTGVCEVDLRNKAGHTAIMLASMTAVESPEDMQVLQQLMELGDVNSVDQVGQTALHLAAKYGRTPIVHLLLAQGANSNAQDHTGTTPLISACERGHISTVRRLLEEANCNIHLKDNMGRCALTLATHTEIVELLKSPTEPKSQEKCSVS